MTNSDISQSGQTLMDTLRLKTFPVGVKFLENFDELPEKARRPSFLLKKKITICQAVTMARNYGWIVALNKDDIICVPAMLAFGMTPAEDATQELAQLFCDVTFKQDLTVSLEEVEEMALMEKGTYEGLLLFPLQKAPIVPDAVAIYGNPAQISRLVQGATYASAKRVTGSFGGKVECSEYLARPFKAEEPRVVIPGMGDRIFSMTMDDELVFSLPMTFLDKLMDGLKESGRKIGARYPITFYQNFQPEFPKIYKDLAEKLGI